MKNKIGAVILLFLLATLSACQPSATPALVETAPVVVEPSTIPETPSTATPLPPTATPQPAAPTAPVSADEDVIYLNLTWHQHQPLYYKDENGVYTRPWARAHATKDYYDMAALLKNYPNVHVTFNLTPVLIRQLDDLAGGAKDYYRVLAEIPADQLADEQKRFILAHFFDANWAHIVARFPRYQQLLDLRGPNAEPETIESALAKYTEQDFRDLQIWWNLAWFDPTFLAQEPLKSLVDKGGQFTEADKTTLFAEVDRVVAGVVPLHRQMQDSGQIEVIITPYAHPILPLLYATKLAAVGDPGAELPELFSYPNDAIAQVQKSVEVYRDHYGCDPRGMWPAEGAVAQEIVKFVADAGYSWMATGEHVLAKSLGQDGFTRDARDTVQEADALYRPYYVRHKDGPPVAVVFRDLRLSDLVGFEYSGDPGDEAAQDFINRLEAIRARLKAEGATGPHLVSVILDGENAWENYDNDGIAFLNALYGKLSESQTIKTVTPSEYLALFPQQRELKNLWPGAWFSSDYGTWIGEPEEKQAWDYLRETREDLAAYDLTKKKTTTPEKLAQALDFMYLAEGSDWFWWYGSDQDSGNDAYFDEAYRALLRGVYDSLGQPAPDFVSVPIIAGPAAPPTQGVQGQISPQIDGLPAAEEWAAGGYYEGRGGSQARAGDVLAALYYGYDPAAFYVRVDPKQSWDKTGNGVLGIYLGLSGIESTTGVTRFGGAQTVLGYGATALVEIPFTAGKAGPATLSLPASKGGWAEAVPQADILSTGGDVLEIAVPFALLGKPGPGDTVNLRAVWSEGSAAEARDGQLVPADGPAQVILPDLAVVNYFLSVDDPAGDDNGPGAYTYPTDAVFEAGAFDASGFKAGLDGDELVFDFTLNGSVSNPWGSGINLSLQTFDVYVDFDPGAGTGARLLLEGRNAALAPGNGWDMAVWAEGWNQKLLVTDEKSVPRELSGDNVKAIVDPAGRVTLRVQLAAVPGLSKDFDPAAFGYAAMILSQDGFPAAGVRRVRDIEPAAAQWRFGGAPADTNHTRIIDLLGPAAQNDILGDYPASQSPASELSPDDFAQIPLLRVE